MTSQVLVADLPEIPSGLAVVQSNPLSFVFTDGLGLYQSSAQGTSSLPAINPDPGELTGVAFSQGALIVATSDPLVLGLGFPPTGGSWATPLWESGSAGDAVTQMVAAGAGGTMVAAASAFGGFVMAGGDGDTCYTQECVPGTPQALNFLTGVAVDASTGTLYLVGVDGMVGGGNVGGAVETIDASGVCTSLRLGTAGACATFPIACSGGCSIDPTLAQQGLFQAAFVAGTLYATGYDTANNVPGGAIYQYSATAGLSLVLGDQTYSALTVAGP